jgi:Domain of unknown function DUF29
MKGVSPSTDTTLYDRDFFEWVQRNVDLLRRGCVEEADLAHIVEELEGLANLRQCRNTWPAIPGCADAGTPTRYLFPHPTSITLGTRFR